MTEDRFVCSKRGEIILPDTIQNHKHRQTKDKTQKIRTKGAQVLRTRRNRHCKIIIIIIMRCALRVNSIKSCQQKVEASVQKCPSGVTLAQRSFVWFCTNWKCHCGRAVTLRQWSLHHIEIRLGATAALTRFVESWLTTRPKWCWSNSERHLQLAPAATAPGS